MKHSIVWPDGWMDQDETWHRCRPQPRPHCVRWGPSSPSKKGAQPTNYWPVSVVAERLDESRCHLVRSGPRPRGHCVAHYYIEVALKHYFHCYNQDRPLCTDQLCIAT